MSSLPPLCLAMLICDDIYVERVTGKVTVFGTFEEFRTSRFPLRLPPVVVYCELSGGRGRSELALEFVHALPGSARRAVSARSISSVDFADPKRAVRVYFAFESLELQVPGEYSFLLEADGSYVAERSLLVLP